ncbi:MAG: hypothetical protein GX780_05205 [Campylobacteraceae bacterium]|nr:hypothetical protein [Campylobacteraceae bacterium]
MPRLIQAPLDIVFEAIEDEDLYLREFEKLSQIEEDPVGQWLKLAKARGETSDSDTVLLTLVAELHRKVDALSSYVRNETPERLDLAKKEMIDAIGFEYINLRKDVLSPGKRYYARILMPIFPKREIPLFLEAKNSTLAQIARMHESDRKDWDSYIMARERIIIRQQKAENDGL